MGKCPRCGNKIQAEFSLVTCSQCGLLVSVDFDGNVTSAEEPSENDSLPQPPKAQPEVEIENPVFAETFPTEDSNTNASASAADYSEFESPVRYYENEEMPAELESESSDEATNPGWAQPESLGIEGDNAFQEIVDFGNSPLSSSKMGGVLYSIKISRIDTIELKKELQEQVSDKKFLWNSDELI